MAVRLIPEKEVCARIGKTRVTIRRWEKLGIFPQRVKIGPNSVAFAAEEIDAWERERLAARVTAGDSTKAA